MAFVLPAQGRNNQRGNKTRRLTGEDWDSWTGQFHTRDAAQPIITRTGSSSPKLYRRLAAAPSQPEAGGVRILRTGQYADISPLTSPMSRY